MLIFYFLMCALVVVLAGYYLSKYGDMLGDVSGISKSVIGGIFISIATSLPEIITSVSAAAIIKEPDLVVSNMFGSNMFNLLILSAVEIMLAGKLYISLKNGKEYIRYFSYGIIMMAVTNVFLIFKSLNFRVGIFNFNSSIIFLTYCIIVFFMTKTPSLNSEVISEKIDLSKYPSKKNIILKFCCAIFFVVAASIVLTQLTDKISLQYNLDKSFAGMIFLAIVTSLPELIVSISAVKFGSIDIALGNVYGSNLFNMLILFFADIFYKGSVLADSNIKNSINGFFGILMAVLVIIGLKYKVKPIFKISFVGISLILIYLTACYISY